MKGCHIPADKDDEPCRAVHTSKALRSKADKQGRTGFRCTKILGHRASDKDPKGSIHAAIGSSGEVHAAWQDKRPS